jgi:branched-chain amino acid transport system substrate-binding protein
MVHVSALIRCAALGALVAGVSTAASAQTVKVGVALDISGPFATTGVSVREGLDLAIKTLGSKLGGVPAQFIQADMAGDPEQARQLVDRMIQRDKIDMFTGPVGSNIALAVGPALFAAKVPYLTANAGPSQYAGAQCNPYFFGVSYQNDGPHEAAGKLAADKGYKKVVTIVANYPAGKDALAGFKRLYNAPLTDEIYTKVGQLDYSAELAQVRADKPDAIYFFLAGSMGINFIKQFVGAGLSKSITLITTAFSADQDVIDAVGEPMLGLYNTSAWSHDLDNPANKAFVAAFRKAYNHYPSYGAQQAYDVVMAMDAAVRDVGGKVSDHAALAKALAKGDFQSVRGSFKYGANHYPIQDYYLRVVGHDADGKITNRTVGKVLTARQDVYVGQCHM